mgnify:CR=1 FL=1
MDKTNIEYVLPEEIEKRSFEIIAAELAERGITLPAEQDPVTRRVIHTSADFDYAETMTYSENAVEIAKNLIKNGADIVTDTNMALAGINKKVLASLISILIGLLVGAVVVTIVGLTKKTIGLAGLWDGIRIVFVGIFCKGRDAAGALEWGFNGRTVGNMLFRATPIIMTGLSVAVSYKTGLFNIGSDWRRGKPASRSCPVLYFPGGSGGGRNVRKRSSAGHPGQADLRLPDGGHGRSWGLAGKKRSYLSFRLQRGIRQESPAGAWAFFLV